MPLFELAASPKIDDIEQKLLELWENSNVDALLHQRKEQGGWIIDTGNGFRLEPFDSNWPVSACGIAPDAPNGFVIDLPENTVGWVHSHPYEDDEDIGAICGKDKKVSYEGRASVGDIQFQRQLTSNAMSQGYIDEFSDFTGVVIDKDGIRITDGGLGMKETLTEEIVQNNTQTEEPCSYK